MTNLAPTYEILGAMSPTVSESKRNEIIDNIDAKVIMVSNTDSQVHLALPYYAGVEKIASYEVSDCDADAVAGGEVIVAVILSATAIGGTAVALGLGFDAVSKNGK